MRGVAVLHFGLQGRLAFAAQDPPGARAPGLAHGHTLARIYAALADNSWQHAAFSLALAFDTWSALKLLASATTRQCPSNASCLATGAICLPRITLAMVTVGHAHCNYDRKPLLARTLYACPEDLHNSRILRASLQAHCLLKTAARRAAVRHLGHAVRIKLQPRRQLLNNLIRRRAACLHLRTSTHFAKLATLYG